MEKKFLLLMMLILPVAAQAETLQIPPSDSAAAAPMVLPERGQTMASVERSFGSPVKRRGPVGGDSEFQPPITRWDYRGFYVVFERDRVIDAVIPDAPPPLHNRDELIPAS